VTVLCYLPWERYDLWWYLRFLLPGLGALFALVAAGLSTIATGVPRPWGSIAATAILLLVLRHAIAYDAALQMFGPFKESEHKYADVGAFIAGRMPADAVFFAMQHSGTIRYYGGRYTLRFDLLDRATASRAPADLERLGLHPYLAIEDAEVPDVRTVFGVAADRPLPWPYVARLDKFGGISILDLATHPAGDAAVPIPHFPASYSPPRQVVIEPRER
jgi:hypothetical protein